MLQRPRRAPRRVRPRARIAQAPAGPARAAAARAPAAAGGAGDSVTFARSYETRPNGPITGCTRFRTGAATGCRSDVCGTGFGDRTDALRNGEDRVRPEHRGPDEGTHQ